MLLHLDQVPVGLNRIYPASHHSVLLSSNQGEPDMPKLALKRVKSTTLMQLVLSKSARPSYIGSPSQKANVRLRTVKSTLLTRLSLLASPARIRPISTLVTDAPDSSTWP